MDPIDTLSLVFLRVLCRLSLAGVVLGKTGYDLLKLRGNGAGLSEPVSFLG